MEEQQPVDPSQRPGIRSTEFWITLVVVIGGSVSTQFTENPIAQGAGILAAALTAMGYGFARAKVKQGAQK